MITESFLSPINLGIRMNKGMRCLFGQQKSVFHQLDESFKIFDE